MVRKVQSSNRKIGQEDILNLTPDYDDEDHYPLIRHGNLQLEINFGTTLPHTINVIVYAEFDNIVKINNNRDIQFDYKS